MSAPENQIRVRTAEVISELRDSNLYTVADFEHRFNVQGCRLGYFRYGPEGQSLNWNLEAYESNPDKYLSVVVPHETCHLAIRSTYDVNGWETQPHGLEWQKAMALVGAEAATTATGFSVTVRRQSRTAVRCPCRQVGFSKTRINRMRRGFAYTCRLCQSEFVEVVNDSKTS